jgi:hypothetical protein
VTPITRAQWLFEAIASPHTSGSSDQILRSLDSHPIGRYPHLSFNLSEPDQCYPARMRTPCPACPCFPGNAASRGTSFHNTICAFVCSLRAFFQSPEEIRLTVMLYVRKLLSYIIPPMLGIGVCSCFSSGFSATIASVVTSSPAIDAASISAMRTTLVGSMIPALIISVYSSV